MCIFRAKQVPDQKIMYMSVKKEGVELTGQEVMKLLRFKSFTFPCDVPARLFPTTPKRVLLFKAGFHFQQLNIFTGIKAAVSLFQTTNDANEHLSLTELCA